MDHGRDQLQLKPENIDHAPTPTTHPTTRSGFYLKKREVILTKNNITGREEPFLEACVRWMHVAFEARQKLLEDAEEVLQKGLSYEPKVPAPDVSRVYDQAKTVVVDLGKTKLVNGKALGTVAEEIFALELELQQQQGIIMVEGEVGSGPATMGIIILNNNQN